MPNVFMVLTTYSLAVYQDGQSTKYRLGSINQQGKNVGNTSTLATREKTKLDVVLQNPPPRRLRVDELWSVITGKVTENTTVPCFHRHTVQSSPHVLFSQFFPTCEGGHRGQLSIFPPQECGFPSSLYSDSSNAQSSSTAFLGTIVH